MRKVLTLLVFAVFFIKLCLAQTAENKEVASVKYNLPEFRDASFWKKHAGLTLFSSDGKYLAISGKTVDVIIYETETGNIISKIDSDGFIACSFSPDGKYLVAQDKKDLEIRIYETETGKVVREIRGMDGVNKLSRDLGGGGLINNIHGISPVYPFEMSPIPTSPDWKNILVNKNDKEFEIFDFETGKSKFELEHAKYSGSWEKTKLVFAFLGMAAGVPNGGFILGSVSNAQFSENGKFLVIASGNKNPTLWEVETGKLLNKFELQERVYFVQFSPNSKMISATDYSGVTRIYEVETGKEISSFGSKKEPILVADWSKNSENIFCISSRKGDVKMIEASTGKLLYIFEKSDSAGVIQSHNGKYIVTVPRKDKKVFFQIWESATGKLIATIPRTKDKKWISSLKWSKNDEMLVTTIGLKNEVELWNNKGEHLQTFKNASFPVQFSNDGKYLLSGGKVLENGKQKDMGFLWEINENKD